jgi:DNA polymerase delta subunit 1
MYTGDALHKNPAGDHLKVPGAKQKPVTILRMYGINAEGNSIMLHVHGFTPYLYVRAPRNFLQEHIPRYREALENRLKNSNGRFERCEHHVLGVQLLTDRRSIIGYQFSDSSLILKIHVALPTMIPTIRSMMDKGFECPGYGSSTYQTYESNIPFTLRFMIDCDITGACWIEIPKGTYSLRGGQSKTKDSRCQIEADICYNSIKVHQPEGEWNKLAPIRVLSFDIECKGRKGHFPEAEMDPVIQIANVVSEQGAKKPAIRNVFALDTCNPIVGADVFSFKDEGDMLLKWAEFVRACDPDIITGYNIQNFDIPYLINRAKALRLKNTYNYWGRIIKNQVRMRDTTFQSSAFGKRENIETTIEGRVIFDMLPYMFRNHKMSSYSLNAVSAEFLGNQKEDVHFSIISDLQNGSAEDRRRLAVYCLKDAYLPLQLMDKLCVMINYVEMARVTGVTIDFLLNRGQQIKVMSMLLRKCQKAKFVIPVLPRDTSDSQYEGATVIEPKKSFYQEPIATLDFASLYPSIMMGYNLCYSTLLSQQDVAKLKPEEYQKTPSGDYFVTADTRKGLLPIILEEILAARKQAKKDMKAATDPMQKAVQNGRQLALKVSANSVYGFTGATVGQLPCLAIASAVTSYGRDLLLQTKDEVEKHYTIENGYKANAVVVYGDTDSVMINFGVPTVAEAMPLAEEAAALVTKKFPKPVMLEFEKVYWPYLLMNKKRYAGLLWTNPDKYDYMDCKGLETVRRDNCLLVRTMIDTCLRKIIIERDGASDAFTIPIAQKVCTPSFRMTFLLCSRGCH